LGVRYENSTLQAVLPECAPKPVEAQLRTVSDDRKIWTGETPVDPSASTFPFTYEAWENTVGTIPADLPSFSGVQVMLVDDDYRAWMITVADSTLLLKTADTDLLLTVDGLTKRSVFRAESCD
jgi:hypothetical protein